jgi:hypothetical protein
MKILIDHLSFKVENHYLDVEIHYGEGWVDLKTETSGSFPIQSKEELNIIYKKLSEIFDSFENE